MFGIIEKIKGLLKSNKGPIQLELFVRTKEEPTASTELPKLIQRLEQYRLKKQYTVNQICELLSISPTTYYSWSTKPERRMYPRNKARVYKLLKTV